LALGYLYIQDGTHREEATAWGCHARLQLALLLNTRQTAYGSCPFLMGRLFDRRGTRSRRTNFVYLGVLPLWSFNALELSKVIGIRAPRPLLCVLGAFLLLHHDVDLLLALLYKRRKGELNLLILAVSWKVLQRDEMPKQEGQHRGGFFGRKEKNGFPVLANGSIAT
jgi:hypothetical protein